MRIEEVVGQRIKYFRESNVEMTQEQFGQRLGELLGREWSRQAVHTAEKGGRAFTAAELVAIAHALGATVARLVTPPPEVQEVELSAGVNISRGDLVSGVLPDDAPELVLENLRLTIQALALHLQLISEASGKAREVVASLDENLDMYADLGSLRIGALKKDEGLPPAPGAE